MPVPKDPEKYKEWKRKQRLAKLGKSPPNKGKTLEEMFGKEKAKEIREKQRLAKLRNPSPTSFKKGHDVPKEWVDKRKKKLLDEYGHLFGGWNKGMKFPEMSKDRIGKGNPMYGQKPWNKDLLGDKNPLFGISRPEEVIKKISKANKGKVRTPEQNLANSKRTREYLLKNPEKHPNYVVSKKGRRTGIEWKTKFMLESFGLEEDKDFWYNKNVRTKKGIFGFGDKTVRFPDYVVFLGKRKYAVECDGGYFHKDKKKDFKRDLELQRIGFSIIHLKEEVINKSPNKALKILKYGLIKRIMPLKQIKEYNPTEIEKKIKSIREEEKKGGKA
jgi:very-short-patch-repair endonuclease